MRPRLVGRTQTAPSLRWGYRPSGGVSRVGLHLVRRGTGDAHLRRMARAPHVRVVLDVLGRGDVHGQAGGQLVSPGLVEQLLIAGAAARLALHVEVVRSVAENPALPARAGVGGHLRRPDLAGVLGAPFWTWAGLGGVQRAP